MIDCDLEDWLNGNKIKFSAVTCREAECLPCHPHQELSSERCSGTGLSWREGK